SGLALLMIDLDRFKPVNDEFGHDIGDALLEAVARRLEAHIRVSDWCARIGGDEFAVVSTSVRDRAAAEAIGARLVDALSTPFRLGGLTLDIGASVGVAWAPDDAVDPEGLVKCADLALYAAKALGRGQVAHFNTHVGGSLH
ncbi:MAG: GGDEF domain-containing protein, partial [Pseudomonadota bacterium]